MRKTILITGASNGIGQQLAHEFAARGYNLALAARTVSKLETLQQQLTATHPDIQVEIAGLDVTQLDSVAPVVEQFAATFGSLDIVVANAGIGDGGGPIGSGGFAKDAMLIQTNVLGAMATIDAAVAIFKRQQHGQIVAISSVAAARGLPGAGSYSASKAAIAVYADAARAELHGSGIKVTTLYPGFIDTDINNQMKSRPFLVSLEQGAKQIAKLIERGVQESAVPKLPWGAAMSVMRHLPTSAVAKQAPFDGE